MINLIVDTSYLTYRSYFVFKHLKIGGEPVGALFGFAKTVLQMVDTFEPDNLIFALDSKQKTFRHEQKTDYKAGRTKTEDEMKSQIPLIHDWARSVTDNVFEVSGYEADDIIYTVAQNCGDCTNLVFSADKDLYQMLTAESTKIIKTDKQNVTLYTKADFVEQYELEPEQWVDFKALVGDKSDNLPGADGVGPVGAKKLLQKYADLDALYEVIDGDAKLDKNLENVKKSLENVKQTRELAQLVSVDGVELQQGFDLSVGVDLFEKYKFGSLTKQLERMGAIQDENALF